MPVLVIKHQIDDFTVKDMVYASNFTQTDITKFDAFLPVVAGTTLGMMIANVPAVILGDRIAHRLPVRAIHATAAVIFVGLAIATVVTG